MKIPSIILVAALLLAGTAAVSSAQWLSSDRPDYSPGETAILTGTDFVPGEDVVLQVRHADATPDSGADHEPWTVVADENGAFVANWHVCEDDCVGASLRATADGQTSGQHAETAFTDAAPLSDTPLSEVPVADDNVIAIATSGTSVYIGGLFSLVGPYTGTVVGIDASTGAPVAGFPKANGTVTAIAPDGSGGWYIGGFFSTVGGVARNRVAHIDASNNVTAWNPDANNSVWALAVNGSVVYAGGDFTSIGGQSRNRVAALDATTGLATSWTPNSNGAILTLTVSGGTVYAGGTFSLIGGQSRNQVAALSASTGLATAWNPNASGTVRVLAVSGSAVYAAGDFSSIGGQSRNRIAALDAATGLATAWNPNADATVTALVVNGSTIYAGGSFFSIGGQARTGIAALDAATGLATGWNPGTFPAGAEAIAVSGSIVYAGGGFTSIGGQQRRRIAALDATTGLATSWNPIANATVRVLAVNGSIVCAGGDFSSVGMQPRSGLASFDATTGAISSWNPNPNAAVVALAVSGSTVYAGGDFTNIGGQPRNRIAALDASTGLASAWGPNANNTVQTMAVSGGTLYAGGNFTTIGGQSRNRIAALNTTTGLATTWNPNANNLVLAVADGGSAIYAAGIFTSVGGQTRNFIAALDPTTGLATAWNPNANSLVVSLAVSGNTIYAGGNFTSIGGQTRNQIAALDGATGLATSWNPNANGQVRLTVSGSTIYTVGSFTTIGGQARNRIAALDATTGLAAAWNPNADGSLQALAVGASGFYAGGSFSEVGKQKRRGLAGFAIESCTPPAITFCPPDVTVECGSSTAPSSTGKATVSGTGVVLSASDVFVAGCGNTGAITRTWTATGTCGTASCVQTISIIDATAPSIGAPGVNATIRCPASPVFTAPATAFDICDPGPQIVEVSDVTTPGSCPGAYSRTKTWKARDCAGNESGPVSQTINVMDTAPPSIGAAGANATIQCPASPVFTAPTASDGCDSSPTVIEVSDVTTAGSCAGVYSRTITWKARDCSGNESGPVSQTIDVMDTTPPSIGAAGASATIVCPASPVFTAPTANDGCDSSPTVIEVSDVTTPGGCPGLYSRTKTWKARDCAGNESGVVSQTINVVNPPPVASITGPVSGLVAAVGVTVNFTGTFADNACGDTHTATWTFDMVPQPGTVNESTGDVSASYTFAAAGVYMVKLTVTDQCGGSSTATTVGGVDAMVVIFDPTAGFVTGGGWIDSPPGAYVPDPLLAGKANFGFVSKYKKGTSVPTGETEFQYKIGNLNFHSTSYDWLVVGGAKAQYKGSGTINNAGDYAFMLTSVDGEISGGGGVDKFRIKITNKTGGGLVYDNLLNAPDSSDPTTVLGGGSIVIHTGGNSASTMAGGSRAEGGGQSFSASAAIEFGLSQNYPNPFDRSTLIAFSLPERSRISLVVYDLVGREVRTLVDGEWEAGRHSATLARVSSNGSTLGAGVYFVRMNAQSLATGRSFSSLRKMVLVK
jgi:hypothetical protein